MSNETLLWAFMVLITVDIIHTCVQCCLVTCKMQKGLTKLLAAIDAQEDSDE